MEIAPPAVMVLSDGPTSKMTFAIMASGAVAHLFADGVWWGTGSMAELREQAENAETAAVKLAVRAAAPEFKANLNWRSYPAPWAVIPGGVNGKVKVAK